MSALFGVALLSGVLTTNYFRTAWRLGLLRAFGRRHPVSWRTIGAGTMAACLPFAGAMLALTLIPTDDTGQAHVDAAVLALQLAGCGLVMHLLNDALVAWATPARP
ncbi:MAG: hypothetical protein EOP40_08645 [Rubrivivax sp.]|nr:MAG: hypothetical protein EOP40_08645 [Rubrivivax sp.]